MSKYHEPWERSNGTMSSWIGDEQKKEIARLFKSDIEALGAGESRESCKYGITKPLPQACSIDGAVGNTLPDEKKSS
jgi:hypothetical protein